MLALVRRHTCIYAYSRTPYVPETLQHGLGQSHVCVACRHVARSNRRNSAWQVARCQTRLRVHLCICIQLQGTYKAHAQPRAGGEAWRTGRHRCSVGDGAVGNRRGPMQRFSPAPLSRSSPPPLAHPQLQLATRAYLYLYKARASRHHGTTQVPRCSRA